MKDIVLPDNNEKEFISMAEKLGFEELVFLYNSSKQFYTGKARIKITNGLLSNEKKVQRNFLSFVQSPRNARFVFEKSRPACIFGLELQKRDFMHQRGSGFNHLMAKLACQNNVAVGFSFSMILNYSLVNRSRIFGRIKQNIRLCRKYNAKMVAASFALSPFEMRAPKDLIAFFTVLGMTAKEARNSLNCVFNKKSVVNLA